MKQITLIGLLSLILLSCGTPKQLTQKTDYPANVGDIEFDEALDDTSFHRCHPEKYTVQYFNFSDGFQFEGEKDSLDRIFHSRYVPYKKKNQNGYVRIRFVVNCKNESGMFRLLTSDFDYQPFQFNPKITDQLMAITKSLNHWKPLSDEQNGPRDYYQYLIFRIEEGEIKEIMP